MTALLAFNAIALVFVNTLWLVERRRRIRAEAAVEDVKLAVAESLARVADAEQLVGQRKAPIFDLSRFRRLHP